MAALDPATPAPRAVVRAFAETARRLWASEDLGEALGRITAAAVDLVPACDLATITIQDGSGYRTEGSTDPMARAVDEAQYRAAEGPCLSAIAEAVVVRTRDAAVDTRWSRFGELLAGLPVRSVVSCPLSVHEGDDPRVLGSLNVYGVAVDAFDDDDVDVVLLLGAHGGVVLHAAHQLRNLRQALDSRDAIGQAKGILMERERLTADQAFDRLRAVSQRVNVKLRAVAERLVLTGELEAGRSAPTEE